MTIVVCPLHEVEEAVARWCPSHAVGMASPGAEIAVLPDELSRLQLRFHDIAEPRDGLMPPSTEDVDRLLAFARTWPRTSPLLIQCWAGVSRSPAAAYIVACALSEPGREEALARGLRAAAPFATPNPLMVDLADRALDRSGAMSAAIAGIGRGADTSLGRMFQIDPNVTDVR